MTPWSLPSDAKPSPGDVSELDRGSLKPKRQQSPTKGGCIQQNESFHRTSPRTVIPGDDCMHYIIYATQCTRNLAGRRLNVAKEIEHNVMAQSGRISSSPLYIF